MSPVLYEHHCFDEMHTQEEGSESKRMEFLGCCLPCLWRHTWGCPEQRNPRNNSIAKVVVVAAAVAAQPRG